ncbi:MAG: zinc ribbon domain-containing protein [Dehalococcoidia bacterium]|nr:zinc ribbon domain-containing protein [Dehalococcoidia bacterium]
MFCPKCGREELGNAAFCRSCGVRLESRVGDPQQPRHAAGVAAQCPNCRNKIDANLAFCPYCGKPLREPAVRETSWAWWLLPICFVWIGGLCAFFAVKDRNSKKAIWLLILGIILTALYYVVFPALLFVLGIALGEGNGY